MNTMQQYGEDLVYDETPSALCLKTMCLASCSVRMPGKQEHGSLLFNGLGARRWQIGMSCDSISFRQAIISIYPRLRTVVGYNLWFINGENKFQRLPEKANTPRRIKGFLGPKAAECLVIVPATDILLMDENLDTLKKRSSCSSYEEEDSPAVLDLRRPCKRCLVCGSSEKNAESFHRIQDECLPGAGHGLTVAGKLNQILGFDLKVRRKIMTMVSDEICRKCLKSVTEMVDLEQRLKEMKEGVVATFFNTASRFQKHQSDQQQQSAPEREQRRSQEQEQRRCQEQEQRRCQEQEQRRSQEQEQRRCQEQEQRRSPFRQQLPEVHEQREVFIKQEPQIFSRSCPEPANPATANYPNHHMPLGYTQHMMFPSLLPNNRVSEINPMSLFSMYPGFRFQENRDEERITELPMDVNSEFKDNDYVSESCHYSYNLSVIAAESGFNSSGDRKDEETRPDPDQTVRTVSTEEKESGYNSSGSVSPCSENESTSSSSCSRTYTDEEEEKRKPMKKRKRAQESETESFKRLTSA